jgi:hypothetical protein
MAFAKKFTGIEKLLLQEGLKLAAEKLRKEIIAYEEEGKRVIMTSGYVTMVEKELEEKLLAHCLKEKKPRKV